MNAFFTRNNSEFGPFISLFDSCGKMDWTVKEPKFNYYKNIEYIQKQDNPIIELTIPKEEPNVELSALWITVRLPNQFTSDQTHKIFYNQYFSGVDIIKSITIYNKNEIKKQMSRAEYQLELENLGRSEYAYLKNKYFDLTKRSTYKNNMKNKLFNFIESDSINLPIFFKPYLKISHCSNIRIEIIFNEISKLYTCSKNVNLNEINYKEIRCTGVFIDKNDKDYFEKQTNKDKTFC